MKKPFLLLLVFIGSYSCSDNDEITQRININYDVVAEGVFYDSETEEQQTVVTNLDDWNQFLNEFPDLELDFETYNYIVVFDKLKPSSGYNLALDITNGVDNTILVTVSYKEYTEDNVLNVLTRPYIIARIEKTEIPILFNMLLEL